MAENSTNVRTEMLRRVLGAWARGLEAVSPRSATRWAFDLFATPRRHRPRSARSQAVLARGSGRWVELEAGRVRVWSWGVGPRVLLVHGWSGHAGQLTALVDPLLAAGFSVMAFDAPAHGHSPGRRLTLPLYVRVLHQVAAATGELHALVAHSFGAAVAAQALREGLAVERAVFLAPPNDLRDYVGEFSRFVGLSAQARARLTTYIERYAGHPLAHYCIPDFAPSMRQPLLVVHDAHDREIPVACGERIAAAWPGAELVRTEGLGHHRVLFAREVLERVAGFVARGRGAVRVRPAVEPATLPDWADAAVA